MPGFHVGHCLMRQASNFAPVLVCYDTVMKILNGSDLAGFIKGRQAQQVRALRQA